MSSPKKRFKILITGASGFLGSYLIRQFSNDYECSGIWNSHQPAPVADATFYQCNLLNKIEINSVVKDINPDVVIHTAALTNVDLCEKQPELAWSGNVKTTENLVHALNGTAAYLIHISTDQLFDGTKKFLNEEEVPSPLNVYGKTKWEAEKLVIESGLSAAVFRTNFFGKGNSDRVTLLDWCYKVLSDQNPNVTLYDDVYYTPISIQDLTVTIEKAFLMKIEGIFNVTGDERVSKAEFFRKVARVANKSSDNFQYAPYRKNPDSAERPREMSLDNFLIKSTLGMNYRKLEDALREIGPFSDGQKH